MMAKEMADHLESNKSAITHSFHLVKDFYPEEVMRNQDIENIQNIFSRLLIGDCQINCVNGHSVKLKCFAHPSFLGGNYGDTTRVIGRVIKGL